MGVTEFPGGRGRLSNIDLLPDEAQEDVLWACGELNKRQRTQKDICAEFNERLRAKGLAQISPSAFNRKATALAALKRRLDDARHIFAGLAERFTPENIEAQDVAIGEFLKLLIFELSQDAEASPKDALDLARGYLATIQGQKHSAERRRKIADEMLKQADKAVAAVAQSQGLGVAARDAILAALRADLK